MSEVYKYSLEIILGHIQICEDRFSGIITPEDFVKTKAGNVLLDSIVIRLQAIGENLKRMLKNNPELIQKYPEIEWTKIIQFRDFISHHYEQLDYEIVFEICKHHLPSLKKVIDSEQKNS